VRRTGHGRVSPFGAGLIALAIIVVALYGAFIHKYPWQNPYELKAVFANANNLAPKSPVRIAGVTVGQVTSIDPKPGSSDSVVTMAINDEGLPLHKDATAKIRPRIFLEGNFFVDLKPGSPQAPTIGSGSEIPVTQTFAPVQIDQVLGVLQSTTRSNTQRLLQGYGAALNGKPLPGEDRLADPSTRGLTAAEALNRSLDNAVPALRDTAIVNQAFLGTEPHDLSRLIDSTGRTAAELVLHEDALKSLVTNFNTTMAAFASQSTALQTSVRLLPDVLAQADRALLHLNNSFPPLRVFSREILPGVRETPATVAASFPWITQTRALVAPDELGGLVNDLSATVPNLAAATDASIKLFPKVEVLHERDPSDRRHTGERPAAFDRCTELQGVLAGAHGPLRRVAELRRQRPVHALPDRWRLALRLDRPGGRRRPEQRAVRERHRAADRDAPGPARHAAAVQPHVPLLQEPDP
jgi:phospholipid/cholesterol/gamma-HCH transport system substrate-binding protein